MEDTTLGDTGLSVNRIGIGTTNSGREAEGRKLANAPVAAPLVGVSSVEHLEEAVEAVEQPLSAEDLDDHEEPYEPVTGHP